MMRRIWLCADDYGIAPGVDTGVRDLVSRGRLNATSVMVVAPSFSSAEANALSALNAEKQRVAIGLHLTLTGPLRPLTSGYAPLADGAFLPLATTLRLAMQQRLDMTALAAEIRAQFEVFAAAFGRPPDFVDGHQHVHLFPQVRQAALESTSWIAPQAWMRQCGSALPLRRRLTDPKGLLIDWLSREFRARATRLGIATNPAFAGTYTFRANADFAALFPSFLEGLPAGGLVMCHPGHVDAELERLDPLTTLRQREYDYFCSDAFPTALKTHDLTLN
ncbi:MAG: ChbG/HpnK family deacetylase [Alphaproteobacteria bacterium]|nr:MAG: ChbG/HpnK family deacetylase [Alphaproteobacteria bacterium]